MKIIGNHDFIWEVFSSKHDTIVLNEELYNQLNNEVLNIEYVKSIDYPQYKLSIYNKDDYDDNGKIIRFLNKKIVVDNSVENYKLITEGAN